MDNRSVFNQALLIPHSSPILNFLKLNVTENYSDIPKREKRKLNMKTGKELFDDKLYTINLYPVSEWRHYWKTLFSYQQIWGWEK